MHFQLPHRADPDQTATIDFLEIAKGTTFLETQKAKVGGPKTIHGGL